MLTEQCTFVHEVHVNHECEFISKIFTRSHLKDECIAVLAIINAIVFLKNERTKDRERKRKKMGKSKR